MAHCKDSRQHVNVTQRNGQAGRFSGRQSCRHKHFESSFLRRGGHVDHLSPALSFENYLLCFALSKVYCSLPLAFTVVDELATLSLGAIDCCGALALAGNDLHANKHKNKHFCSKPVLTTCARRTLSAELCICMEFWVSGLNEMSCTS